MDKELLLKLAAMSEDELEELTQIVSEDDQEDTEKLAELEASYELGRLVAAGYADEMQKIAEMADEEDSEKIAEEMTDMEKIAAEYIEAGREMARDEVLELIKQAEEEEKKDDDKKSGKEKFMAMIEKAKAKKKDKKDGDKDKNKGEEKEATVKGMTTAAKNLWSALKGKSGVLKVMKGGKGIMQKGKYLGAQKAISGARAARSASANALLKSIPGAAGQAAFKAQEFAKSLTKADAAKAVGGAAALAGAYAVGKKKSKKEKVAALLALISK